MRYFSGYSAYLQSSSECQALTSHMHICISLIGVVLIMHITHGHMHITHVHMHITRVHMHKKNIYNKVSFKLCLCCLLNILADFSNFCIQANSVDPDQTAPKGAV